MVCDFEVIFSVLFLGFCEEIIIIEKVLYLQQKEVNEVGKNTVNIGKGNNCMNYKTVFIEKCPLKSVLETAAAASSK